MRLLSRRVWLMVLVMTGWVAAPASAEWLSDRQAIMGTSVSVKLWHRQPDQGREAIDAVMAEMRRIDAALSPYKPDSELSMINRLAAGKTLEVSQEMARLLDKALYFSRVSDGAFDISFASVGQYYDYRKGEQPTADQRQRLLPAVDYRLIDFDESAGTVHFQHPDLQIDLGGIAKGYAVDRGAAILRERGIEHATVSAGGDSRILGDKRGEPWVVGIKKPRGLRPDATTRRDQVAIMLPLRDTAISTSGDYERFFIDDASGERVHHIINPATGESADGVVSVSVIGPRGIDTDPLSTTVFVMGVDAGLKLVNRLAGFDCVIIDSRGKVHYSDGLAPPVQSPSK